MQESRANLYLALAEALGNPPAWLAQAGNEWPLFSCARSLAANSRAAARAVDALADIAAESLAARQTRYEALFAGPGPPRFSLYESLHRDGHLLGPTTLALEQLYAAAGLQIADHELPDHASLELAFLAHVSWQAASDAGCRQQWRRVERRFAHKHAGRWLPDVGRALAASGDDVYAPVGLLLAEWLEEVTQRRVARRPPRLPGVTPEQCTLCGFCVQVCPSGALKTVENEFETDLLLFPSRCSGCGLCLRVCKAGAMCMRPANESLDDRRVADRQLLRRSPRAVCPGCGRPTISRAELEFVAGRIGHPSWLDYCLRCRAG